MYQATKRVLSLFGRKVAAGVDTANNFAEFAFFGCVIKIAYAVSQSERFHCVLCIR